MQSREWHQVCGNLVQINVEVASESHRCGQVGQQPRHQAVHAVEPRGSVSSTSARITAGIPPVREMFASVIDRLELGCSLPMASPACNTSILANRVVDAGSQILLTAT